nr:MAG TPA: hypothetical protein [Caudoviricetes sp.]
MIYTETSFLVPCCITHQGQNNIVGWPRLLIVRTDAIYAEAQG